MKSLHQKPMLVLDFGSQYTQLIARRIRELGVYCEIYPFDSDITLVKQLDPCGIILSGGPASVTLATGPRAPAWVFECNQPILGICYGMQVMAVQLQGEVKPSLKREFGYARVICHASALLDNIDDTAANDNQSMLDVWMSHGDSITILPQGFNIICSTANTPIAGIANEDKKWFGLQFHPELSHTPLGLNILKRFALDICQAPVQWVTHTIIDNLIATIQQQVGNDQVLLGLSGGVDSSVVAVLLHRALGHKLTCMFIDTGLLRKNEAEQIMTMFNQHLGVHVIKVNAQTMFLQALAGINCPEQKRKIIGRLFIEVFEEQAQSMPGVTWLAQGTIYPDVIESAAVKINSSATVIKSHHNVGGLPARLNLKLLEPIRQLFKDEVRNIGLELGLPDDIIYRHPFPGPGLAVRIVGLVCQDYIDILRQADAIFIDELQHANLYHQVSQAFAVFLPIKSVGVIGDNRCYDYVISLRAVKTVDFMSAQWAYLPWDFLNNVSTRIINEVVGVSRVTYDISSKPPATIEWE